MGYLVEIVVELVLELLFNGADEVVRNREMPKPLRIMLAFLLIVVMLAGVAVIGLLGLIMLKKILAVGIIIFVFDLVLVIFIIKQTVKLIKSR
ncbi:MAG: hypothetical protein E7509_05965 [Ruminococcus sp.]|nr:hypothetical protein [Ruminococcus sp.]